MEVQRTFAIPEGIAHRCVAMHEGKKVFGFDRIECPTCHYVLLVSGLKAMCCGTHFELPPLSKQAKAT
jgi:hypothetical protein